MTTDIQLFSIESPNPPGPIITTIETEPEKEREKEEEKATEEETEKETEQETEEEIEIEKEKEKEKETKEETGEEEEEEEEKISKNIEWSELTTMKERFWYLYEKIPKAKCCNLCCCGYICFCLSLLLIPFFVILDAILPRYPTFETLYMKFDSGTVQFVPGDILVNLSGIVQVEVIDYMHVKTTFNYLNSYLYYNNTNHKLTKSSRFDLLSSHNMPGFNSHTNLPFVLNVTNMGQKVWSSIAYTYITAHYSVPLVLFSSDAKLSVPSIFNAQLYAMLHCDLVLNGSEFLTYNVITPEELALLSGVPLNSTDLFPPSSPPPPPPPHLSRSAFSSSSSYLSDHLNDLSDINIETIQKETKLLSLPPTPSLISLLPTNTPITAPPSPEIPLTLPPTPDISITLPPTPEEPPITPPPSPSNGLPMNTTLSLQYQALSNIISRIVEHNYKVPVVRQECKYGLSDLLLF